MFEKKSIIAVGAALAVSFFLFGALSGLWAKPLPTGSLTGYVYGSDGTTPSEGAVVVLKNLASGNMYRSEPASKQGFFRMENLERGLYIFGAMTEQGEFNGRDILGIEGDGSARLAISLDIQSETQTAARTPNQPPAIRGERFLGRVLTFDTSTMEAQIFVEQGEIRLGDNIHFFGDKEKGSETDFYQTAREIKQNGRLRGKVVAGQHFFLFLEKPVLEKDWVYLKDKSGLGALFLTPIGMATVLASSTGIVYTVTNPPPEVSVHRH